MTELIKVGGIGLLDCTIRNLTISCGWNSPSFYCTREKEYIDLKSDYKESVLQLLHENSLLFYPWL